MIFFPETGDINAPPASPFHTFMNRFTRSNIYPQSDLESDSNFSIPMHTEYKSAFGAPGSNPVSWSGEVATSQDSLQNEVDIQTGDSSVTLIIHNSDRPSEEHILFPTTTSDREADYSSVESKGPISIADQQLSPDNSDYSHQPSLWTAVPVSYSDDTSTSQRECVTSSISANATTSAPEMESNLSAISSGTRVVSSFLAPN
ncbi:unnamed protein product, partial [Protopolystoma xenopodis]